MKNELNKVQGGIFWFMFRKL